MFRSADNDIRESKLEVKSAFVRKPLQLDHNPQPKRPNPVSETFRDVSPIKLIASTWRVFWRIQSIRAGGLPFVFFQSFG